LATESTIKYYLIHGLKATLINEMGNQGKSLIFFHIYTHVDENKRDVVALRVFTEQGFSE